MIQGEINRIVVLAKSGEVVPVPVIAPQRFYIDFNESINPPVRAGACAIRLVLLRGVCALTGTCFPSMFLDRRRPDSPRVAGRRRRSAGNTLSRSGSSSGAENRRSFGQRCVSNSDVFLIQVTTLMACFRLCLRGILYQRSSEIDTCCRSASCRTAQVGLLVIQSGHSTRS